jgi:hypothetical protein
MEDRLPHVVGDVQSAYVAPRQFLPDAVSIRFAQSSTRAKTSRPVGKRLDRQKRCVDGRFRHTR